MTQRPAPPPRTGGSSSAGNRAVPAGLLLLLLAALGIRILGAALPSMLPDGDALGYLEVSRHVARGEGLSTNWTRSLPCKGVSFPLPFQGYPALPLLTGFLGRAGLPLEGAGLGLVLSFLALGILGIFLAWRALQGEEEGKGALSWAALFPPALLAFHKHLTVATVEVLTDGPGLALGIWCFLFLLRARRQERTGPFLLLSLSAGLAAMAGGLFRFQDLFLLGLGPAWFLLGAKGRRKLTGTLAFLFPLLPAALAFPGGPARVESLLSSQPHPAPLRALAAAFAPASPHSLFAGLGPLVWFSLGGLLLLALTGRLRFSSGWFLALLYLAAGLLPLLFVRPENGWLHPWFFADRPALQLLPPLLLFAAFPLARSRGKIPGKLYALALLVLLLLSARASWRYAWKRKRLVRPPEITRLLATLPSLAGTPSAPFLSPEMRFLAWEGGYAGFQARDPYSLRRVLESLRDSGVKWVVVTSRWDRGIPWARRLLELPPSRVPAPLTLKGDFRWRGQTARIFQVARP